MTCFWTQDVFSRYITYVIRKTKNLLTCCQQIIKRQYINIYDVKTLVIDVLALEKILMISF